MSLRDSTVHCSGCSTQSHRLPSSILRRHHNPTRIQGRYSIFGMWDYSTSSSRSAAGQQDSRCRRRCSCSLSDRPCRLSSISGTRDRSTSSSRSAVVQKDSRFHRRCNRSPSDRPCGRRRSTGILRGRSSWRSRKVGDQWDSSGVESSHSWGDSIGWRCWGRGLFGQTRENADYI